MGARLMDEPCPLLIENLSLHLQPINVQVRHIDVARLRPQAFAVTTVRAAGMLGSVAASGDKSVGRIEIG